MPNNYMHLSSRLPKKNYEHSLDTSGQRNGGGNFKNQYHNTMGKKKAQEKSQSPEVSPKMQLNQQESPREVLKLPTISPAKQQP